MTKKWLYWGTGSAKQHHAAMIVIPAGTLQ
jgi:hypothetical protein